MLMQYKGTGDTALKSRTARKPQTKQSYVRSDAATLGRTAAVVRGRRDVLDRTDLEARGLEERIAVSRPEPGPLTKTSTLRMPCSWARRAADSAAICAANGVDLREPLKPTWPAEAQEITLPVGSVMDTIVLLNVLLM